MLPWHGTTSDRMPMSENRPVGVIKHAVCSGGPGLASRGGGLNLEPWRTRLLTLMRPQS
jgi:hypothetical protein